MIFRAGVQGIYEVPIDAALAPFGVAILDPENLEMFSFGRLNGGEVETFGRERTKSGTEEAFSCERSSLEVGLHGGWKGSGAWTHPCSTTDLSVSMMWVICRDQTRSK